MEIYRINNDISTSNNINLRLGNSCINSNNEENWNILASNKKIDPSNTANKHIINKKTSLKSGGIAIKRRALGDISNNRNAGTKTDGKPQRTSGSKSDKFSLKQPFGSIYIDLPQKLKTNQTSATAKLSKNCVIEDSDDFEFDTCNRRSNKAFLKVDPDLDFDTRLDFQRHKNYPEENWISSSAPVNVCNDESYSIQLPQHEIELFPLTSNNYNLDDLNGPMIPDDDDLDL